MKKLLLFVLSLLALSTTAVLLFQRWHKPNRTDSAFHVSSEFRVKAIQALDAITRAGERRYDDGFASVELEAERAVQEVQNAAQSKKEQFIAGLLKYDLVRIGIISREHKRAAGITDRELEMMQIDQVCLDQDREYVEDKTFGPKWQECHERLLNRAQKRLDQLRGQSQPASN